MMNFLQFAVILLVVFLGQLHSTSTPASCFFEKSHNTKEDAITKDEFVKIRLRKHIPSRTKGSEQNIPYIIHQTNEEDELPADMVLAIESTIEQNPEYQYHFFNGTERREFLKQHMGPTVLACYDKLIPKAYKADLFRYSAVFTHGGCYADIGFIFTRPLRNVIRSDDIFISTADGLLPRVSLNSAFFCATAGNPLLKLTIQNLVQNVAESKYGNDMLDISGPELFKQSFRKYFNNEQLLLEQKAYTDFGNGIRLLKQDIDPKCRIYPVIDVFHNAEPILFHKYPRYTEDMSVYTKEPHYSRYWFNKTVYDDAVTIKPDGEFLQASS